MKTFLVFTFSLFVTLSIFSKPDLNNFQGNSSIVNAQVLSDANNISTYIWNTGVFNGDLRYPNTPGFQWPKGTNKFAIFSSGLTTAAFINDSIRFASASYVGEYQPGYILNGIPITNENFKLYRINRGDNNSNPDYANWGLMVPYGAPFDDVNNNGVYDAGTDKPGIKNAAQTIFACLTDGFPETHVHEWEGFAGGTLPMKAEMHLTVWSYDNFGLEDVQFVRMEMINRNASPWNKTQFGFICDADLGEAVDDYVGCDSTRSFGYCYNADNQDGSGTGNSYGTNPPAVGFDMLKGGVNRSISPSSDMYMTSFTFLNCGGSTDCENPCLAGSNMYNFMKGVKKDLTPYINPLTMKRTKFCYSGDPETNSGWTEYTGKINNCGGDTTGVISSSMPGDRRLIMGSGADNFTIMPGEKQTFIFAQMMARGSNNKNSVTKLKQLDDAVQIFYNNNLNVAVNTISSSVPEKYSLHQNYPNPFNPSTKIKFDMNKSGFTSLTIFDMTGKEVMKLVNQNLNAGTYEYEFNAADLPSGIYFYRLNAASFTETKKMSLIK